MKLNEIARPAGNKKAKPRKGRGPGTGNGKTAGRGHKGQNSRSGAKHRAWFEGGQMPINRRLPKRGFYNPFTVRYQVVNLRDLDRVGEVTELNAEVLAHHGLVKNPKAPIKLLGDGAVTRPYTIEVERASKSAVEAIQAAGGAVNLKS
ncbi:50S ribosomal protein L15 [bacterium]|nr:MAG: 50S ribosomal protein L15 [bacterium]RKZ16587.1 MAG: 50S ribosomal protein L15 [bacterium]